MMWRFIALLFVCGIAHAEDSISLNHSEIQQSAAVKRAQLNGIQIFWIGTTPPDAKELGAVETFSGRAFGQVSDEGCAKAFAAALENVTLSLSKAGYDAATDLHVEGSSGDSFNCSSGPGGVSITLKTRPVLTSSGAETILAREKTISSEPRNTDFRTLFVDFQEVFNDERFLKATKKRPVFLSNQPAPEFSERYGAETFTGQFQDRRMDEKERCLISAFEVFADISSYASDLGHDAIIRVYSNLYDELSPAPNQFECKMEARGAKVSLRATTVKLRKGG